jgi:hypothetical protein
VADAYLLTDFTHEQVQLLLPRGINVVRSERHGGAIRVHITGKELTDGMGYQLVSTDGPLLRCIELVENPVEEDPVQGAEPQPRLKPKTVKTNG